MTILLFNCDIDGARVDGAGVGEGVVSSCVVSYFRLNTVYWIKFRQTETDCLDEPVGWICSASVNHLLNIY